MTGLIKTADIDIKYGHRLKEEITYFVQILPNGMNCCTIEMNQTSSNYPKYGTILASIKHFKFNDTLYVVDGSIDFFRTQQLYQQYYNQSICNQKLILELSVMYKEPSIPLDYQILDYYFNKSHNYGWEVMKPHLNTGESWVKDFTPLDYLSLTTDFVPIPLNRNKAVKGTRVTKCSGGLELSLVIKQFARNINSYQYYSHHSRLTYHRQKIQYVSPLQAFNTLTNLSSQLIS